MKRDESENIISDKNKAGGQNQNIDKLVEQQILRSSTIYKQILNTVPHAVFWKDTNSVYLGCNKTFAEHVGIESPEFIIGKTDYELPWLKNEAAAYISDDKEVMNSKKNKMHIIEPLRKADGTCLIIDTSKVPLIDETGNVIGVLGIYNDISEKIKSELSLIESEERYRRLFETMAEGVVYQDKSGNIISANPSALNILGYKLDELLSRTSHDSEWKSLNERGEILPGDQHPSMLALKTGKEIKNFVMAVYNPAKKDYVWISINAVPLFNSGENQPYQVYTTFSDITEQKRSTERIKILAELLDVSSASIIVHDLKGNLLFINKSTLVMHGYSEVDVQNLRLQDLVSPAMNELIETHLESIIKNGEAVFETKHLRKDGSTFPIMVSAKVTKWDNKDVILSVGADISNIKITEENLRLSEERLRTLISNAPLIIFSFDKNAVFTLSEGIGLEAIGLKPGEVVGKSVFDIYKNNEHICNSVKRALNGQKVTCESLVGEKVFDTSYNPVFSSSGEVEGVIGVAFDITQRSKAEEDQRFATRRLDYISRMTGATVGSKSVAEISQELAKQICECFNVDSCVIRLLVDDYLALFAAEGVPVERLAQKMPIFGIASEIINKKSPLIIHDSGIHPVTKDLPVSKSSSFIFISYAGVPIMLQDKVLGIIGVYTQKERRDFSQIDIEHLQIISNHAAIILANERLYKETASQRDLLEKEIAERKHAEEERLGMERRLLHSQKLESLGVLAGGIAHDFNNLLMAILGNLDLAYEDLSPVSSARPNIEEAIKAGKRAADLTRQMLAYSGKGKFISKPLNLNELVEENSHILKAVILKMYC